MSKHKSETRDPELEQDSAFTGAEDAANVSNSPEESSFTTTGNELKQKLEEAEKRALLYQADLENFRKRKNRETAEQLKYANLPLMQSLLVVLDNFERALESARNEESESASLLQGVEMVFAQLQSALEGAGCERINAVGQPFDPNIHEALMMQASEAQPNTVISEAQPGYRLHDRVIRPVKVIISTGPNS